MYQRDSLSLYLGCLDPTHMPKGSHATFMMELKSERFPTKSNRKDPNTYNRACPLLSVMVGLVSRAGSFHETVVQEDSPSKDA